MPNERDHESGQFREQYPTEEFVTAVGELSMATTSKVADKVGCSYDLAYRRLNSLAEDGKIEKADVGGSFVWTMNEE
ncbi:transcriptional regulator [Haloarchaeobius iranensis]|uniref:transcriptional regulator n=1 Tax=Haloarchaeobius iranensis TaxID=996166 RepID=UPI000B7D1D7E|nr:transcriptional regulator [Haloarchaeobius iranensis]